MDFSNREHDLVEKSIGHRNRDRPDRFDVGTGGLFWLI